MVRLLLSFFDGDTTSDLHNAAHATGAASFYLVATIFAPLIRNSLIFVFCHLR